MWTQLDGAPRTRQLTTEEIAAKEERRIAAEAAAEADRLLGRKGLRARIAANAAVERRVDELAGLIADTRYQCDALAAEHAAKCGPIQAQLKQLADEHLAHVHNGNGAADFAARRRELGVQLEQANAELEAALKPLHALIEDFEEERLLLASKINPTLQGELYNSGSPALKAAHNALTAAAAWARSYAFAVAERGGSTVQQRANIEAAQALLARLTAEAHQALRAVYDE